MTSTGYLHLLDSCHTFFQKIYPCVKGTLPGRMLAETLDYIIRKTLHCCTTECMEIPPAPPPDNRRIMHRWPVSRRPGAYEWRIYQQLEKGDTGIDLEKPAEQLTEEDVIAVTC